jgi:hypothetical protein
MSGTVTFTHTIGGGSVSTPGVLLLEWPGNLRLEVQDPVGSMLLLLVVSEGRFWLYDQSRRDNLTGPLKSLPAGLVPSLQPEEILRVFLARPPLEFFRQAPVEGSSAVVREEMREHLLLWDSAFFPREWVIKQGGGREESVAWDDFTFRGGAHYPGKVRLRRMLPGQAEQSATILWNDWEPSVPKEKKLFHIPPAQGFGRPTKALP